MVNAPITHLFPKFVPSIEKWKMVEQNVNRVQSAVAMISANLPHERSSFVKNSSKQLFFLVSLDILIFLSSSMVFP